MARRRRSRSSAGSRSLMKPLVVLLLLAAAGVAAWMFAPASWLAALRGEARQTTTTTEVPIGPRNAGAGEVDACALASLDAVKQALGAGVDARHVGAGADIPAAGACTWATDDNKASAVAMVFTRASLEHGGGKEYGAVYFRTVLTGLEYAFKVAPTMLPGVGDEAALIGFGIDSGESPQIVVRRGERVLHLVFRGVDRDHAVRLAKVLASAL